ncbi:PITH domain-containing protein [Lentinula raphanica]|uniref:PITH domain-containing protein n=1 Tax=Lentinula raphanica TaxID=153919 RepID=A0AA38UEB2_9AGAR|nr:PITH domain-containing protein [Lentinula raphanica]KAJ3838484.1 PITH domain-containing protein [Lentinula raphanica]KAJ3977945.1 PITH domain-containing protein [Lentinula raphanica]
MDGIMKSLAERAIATSSSKEQGDVSLLQFLDLQQLNCLNESSEHNFKSIVSSKSVNTSNSYLESDADEQLLLNVAFNQAVRVKSLIIKSTDIAHAPKKIKLAVNRPNLGFDDVADAEEPAVAQILELDQETVTEGKPVALRFVRFQSVNSLHIFVVSNHGDEEETKINAIDVIGVPVETTKDLSGLRQKQEN